MTLRIVADENIPNISEALASLGAEVVLRAGRSLSPADIRDADALMVRSVTRVDRALLDGSRVRFVATATIGIDHLDTEYLDQRGIVWTSAAGSNANSVVEYVLASILEVATRRGDSIAGKALGIVGCGNIGARLAEAAPKIGLRVLRNDPPRQETGEQGPWCPLDELLRSSDIVSFHVPLNREGPHRTVHLVGADELAQLKPGAILVNAARGPVVDNAALGNALRTRRDLVAVLDTWEREPDLDRSLLPDVAVASPHIAGYSLDGKLNGTAQIAMALARFLGGELEWQPSLPEPRETRVRIHGESREARLLSAIRAAYDIRQDDARLREGANLEQAEWNAHFDRLRKEYPIRREFCAYSLANADEFPAEASELQALGFRIAGNA